MRVEIGNYAANVTKSIDGETFSVHLSVPQNVYEGIVEALENGQNHALKQFLPIFQMAVKCQDVSKPRGRRAAA